MCAYETTELVNTQMIQSNIIDSEQNDNNTEPPHDHAVVSSVQYPYLYLITRLRYKVLAIGDYFLIPLQFCSLLSFASIADGTLLVVRVFVLRSLPLSWTWMECKLGWLHLLSLFTKWNVRFLCSVVLVDRYLVGFLQIILFFLLGWFTVWDQNSCELNMLSNLFLHLEWPEDNLYIILHVIGISICF